MVEIPEVVARMEHWIKHDRGICHHVVNSGMHGVMAAHRDPKLSAIFDSVDLFAPDGILMVLVARFRGFKLKKKNTGPDVLWEFARASGAHGYKYEEALAEGETSAEAHNGIGWCKARLGETQDAIDSFKKAVEKDTENADAYAGLAGAYFADADYERAIASARSVLSRSPEYSSHHDDIRTADIRVLLAESYYNVGDYTAARAQIDLLGGSGRTLDSSSPTYLADLLSVIEELTRRNI